MSKPVLQAVDLCKRFDESAQAVDAVRHVNLQLLAGERVAIVGTSGSGKTSLLQLLAGLDAPCSGEVLIDGQPLHGLSEVERSRLRNQRIGFVYQFHHLLPEFTAVENVAMPLLMAGSAVKKAAELARDQLKKVGLEHRFEHKPAELSGGERQRVAIARALVNQPAVVFADEPTGNLDSHSAEIIEDLMLELSESLDTAFLVVTHDQHLAQRLGRVWHMRDGSLQTDHENI